MCAVNLLRGLAGNTEIIAAKRLRAVDAYRGAGEAFLCPLAGKGKPGGPLAQVGVGELLACGALGCGAHAGIGPYFVDVFLEAELDVVDKDGVLITAHFNIAFDDALEELGLLPRIFNV